MKVGPYYFGGAEVLDFESAIWWEATTGSVLETGQCTNTNYTGYILLISIKLITLEVEKL